MAKKSWAKGRKEPTCLVRIEPDVYYAAKEESEKEKMTLKLGCLLFCEDS